MRLLIWALVGLVLWLAMLPFGATRHWLILTEAIAFMGWFRGVLFPDESK